MRSNEARLRNELCKTNRINVAPSYTMLAEALTQYLGKKQVKKGFLVIGPDVSSVLEIGTIPDLLTKPIVGFKPTIEFAEDGERIDPDVSEPSATLEKFAEIAKPLPELDPPESHFFLP